MVDERGALWIPSPHHWDGREGHLPRWIILHGTAGGNSAQAIANWFAQASAQASANYVIGQDGIIVQCVNEADAAWSNGGISGPPGTGGDGVHHDSWWDSGINPNLLTISIEHVKPHLDNSDSLTEAQKQASFRLINNICERWKIPARKADKNGGITGHFSMDPVNRSRCPGSYPWNELWSYLAQSEMTMLQINQISAFFEEIELDKRWRCKVASSLDGHTYEVADTILNFYRTFGQVGFNGFSIFGLPTSGEIHVANTQRAVVQHFERGAIMLDPQHEVDSVPGLSGPCYPAHIDKGPGQDPRLGTLTGQVKDLQTQVRQYQGSLAGQCMDALRNLKSLVSQL